MIATYLAYLANFVAAASPAGSGARASVDYLEIARSTVYFGFLEDSLAVGDDTKRKYFHTPALMQQQRDLRQAILSNWLNGKPPLSVEQLTNLAKSCAGGELGTALLMCHNLLKSMANGSRILPWNRVGDWMDAVGVASMPTDISKLRPHGESGPIDRDNDYTDGTLFYRPKKIHAAGSAVNPLGQPSIWHLLFDKTSHGLTGPDPDGDWYHFFLMATVGYYAAHPGGRMDDLWEPNDPITEKGLDAWTAVFAMIKGQNAYEGVHDSLADMVPARLAWAWGNALSFVEGSMAGSKTRERDPNAAPTTEEIADVRRESAVHRAGLLYGLELANAKADVQNTWYWYVPVPGTLQVATATWSKLALGALAMKIIQDGPMLGSDFAQGAFESPTGTFTLYANLPPKAPAATP